jgi:hypothetical protein
MFNDLTTTSGGYATINGSSCTTLGTTGTTYIDSLGISGGLTLNHNTTSMNQQVKVAVFKVTRSKHNEIKSSEFITEMWIENKPGVSIDFAVAKKLDSKYEADEIVIKQIFTVTL